MNSLSPSANWKQSFVVFSDDWGRHPSSCQHIFNQRLQDYDVTWVNTIGMRPPRLDWLTAKRVTQKLTDWTRREQVKTSPKSQLSESPRILNPKMWPWMKTKLDRFVNKNLLKSQIQPHLGSHTTGITTIPITCDLMDEISVDRWVYYCVDDFSEWPGLDQKSMLKLERGVIEKSDLIIAASETLQRRMEIEFDREARLLTHGVDLEFWNYDQSERANDPFAGIERPIFLFWGVIDQRLDINFLKRLNDSITEGSIVLIGPRQNPDPALRELSNVKILPAVPFQQLPRHGHFANVLIMPYVDSPVTQAMQPLKLLEYLATQRPAVVRSLPATIPFSNMLSVARTSEEFVSAVKFSNNHGISETQRYAREDLKNESWECKANQFFKFVTASE